MKILFECHHGIGDVVMTFPALYHLKKIYPEAEITYLGGLEAEIPLVMHTGYVKRCYVHNVKKNTMKDLAMLALQFRKERFDLGIAMGQSPRGLDVALLKLAGCKKIISMKNENAVYKKYKQVDISMHKHRVMQHVELIRALGEIDEVISKTIEIAPEQMDIVFSKYQIADIDNAIGIALGTGDFFYRDGKKKVLYNTKKWDINKFAELAKQLIADGYEVFLLGSEKEKSELIESGVKFPEKCIDLLGKGDILSTIAVMKKCRLIVGADTGPMHCAAAAGVPTITLFGPTDAENIGPFGSLAHAVYGDRTCINCYSETVERGRYCEHKKCMASITVEQVYEKIKETLQPE